jgi:hypothetical protein
MTVDRVNRIVFALLGLLLLGAGICGTLAGTGAFGHNLDRRALTDNAIARYPGSHGVWFWPVAVLAVLILALLAARWLIAALVPAPRGGDITLPGDRSAGTTRLSSDALADSIDREIAGYPGVHSVDTDVYGPPTDPHLAVTVRLDRDADPAATRQLIEARALTHAREALDHPRLPIRLDLTVTGHRGARVA